MYAQPRIFLVHGWNSVMKNEVVVFLGTELGLSLQVMELEAMRGRTLPEKFEELARAASFAVVIVTADEKIVTEQGDSIWRIRPNILVELGFFWGLLGRERLAILVERPTETEIPTDLSGIGYLSLENGFSGIKFNLLQELKGAGIVP